MIESDFNEKFLQIQVYRGAGGRLYVHSWLVHTHTHTHTHTVITWESLHSSDQSATLWLTAAGQPAKPHIPLPRQTCTSSSSSSSSNPYPVNSLELGTHPKNATFAAMPCLSLSHACLTLLHQVWHPLNYLRTQN